MRVFLTGATGFIGRNLIEGLEHEIVSLVRNRDHGLNTETVLGNIQDLNRLPQCDAVVHVAGMLGSRATGNELWDVHVSGTRNILSLCSGQRLVYISSAGVLGPCENADESLVHNPTNAYERSKAEAERLASNYLNHVILRPEFIYGPHDMHVLKLFRSIKERKFRLIGKGESMLHPTYVGDVVEAIRKGLECRPGIYNIAGERALCVREYYAAVAGVLGVPTNRLAIPYRAARLYASMNLPLLNRTRLEFFTNSRTFDTTRARRELGFEPLPLEEGLRRTIEWYRSTGML
jgi:nucleoside-diphosphate-sugar epimerase